MFSGVFRCFPCFCPYSQPPDFESAANYRIFMKLVKTVRNQDAHQSDLTVFWWIKHGISDTTWEHFSRTFPVGTTVFDDHCCTPVTDGSEMLVHFRNGIQDSQRWRSSMNSSVRWPKSDEFPCFSCFSLKSEFSQKTGYYCGFWYRENTRKHEKQWWHPLRPKTREK